MTTAHSTGRIVIAQAGVDIRASRSIMRPQHDRTNVMTEHKEPRSFDALPDDEADRAGDRAPIRQTAAGELEGLFRFAAAQLGHNAHMAADVVQQALLVAMAHSSPPSRAHDQRAWLRGIVHNVIRSQMRSARRGREAMNKACIEYQVAQGKGGNDDGLPIDQNRARVVRAVYEAVMELDQAEQDLFFAFYRAGRSHACIAAELGTTSKGVETRLYRLRSRLRRVLERCGERLS
jgi:RNA polymerase sigma-70 factor (ECF subfamily)